MNLAATLRLNNRGFLGPLGQSQRAVGSLHGSLLRIVGPLAAVTGGVIGLGAAVHQLNRSIDEASQMESLEVSMEVLTGSAATAKQLLGELVEFAARTPFTLNDLAPASKQLLAFGVDAGEVTSYLRRLGDVASALDVPLGELVEVYGRNLVQGRLFARDIYQFQNRGIPIIQELAKHFGVVEEEILGMVSAGKVSSQDMDQAFKNMTESGGVFFGMMDRQSQIWRGKTSTLRDMWAALQRAFGRPVIEAALPGLDKGIRLLTDFVPKAESIGKSIATLLGSFRGASANGRLGELVGKGLEYGFSLALNVLYAGLSGAVMAFGDGMGLAFGNIDAIEDVLTGAAAQFGAALLKAVQTPLAHIQGFMEQMAATPWLALAMGTGQPGAAASFSAGASARAQRIMEEGGPTFGFGDGALNADQINEQARAKMAQGMALLVQPLSEGVQEIFTKLRERGIEDFAGAAGIKAELSGLMNELKETLSQTKASIKDAVSAKGAGGKDGTDSISSGGIQLEALKGDRLSRIGGFIGSAGGPALDYARRTAQATERVAKKLTDYERLLQPTGARQTALYA